MLAALGQQPAGLAVSCFGDMSVIAVVAGLSRDRRQPQIGSGMVAIAEPCQQTRSYQLKNQAIRRICPLRKYSHPARGPHHCDQRGARRVLATASAIVLPLAPQAATSTPPANSKCGSRAFVFALSESPVCQADDTNDNQNGLHEAILPDLLVIQCYSGQARHACR